MTLKDLRELEISARRYNGAGTATVLDLIAEIRRLYAADAIDRARRAGAEQMRADVRAVLAAAMRNDRPLAAIAAAVDNIGREEE